MAHRVTAVDLRDVTFRYAAAAADALAGVTLSVAAGETCWVYGAPGAGASTLLLAVAGLAPRFTGGTIAGHLRILGEDPREAEGRGRLRGRIGYLGSVPDLQLSGVAGNIFEEIAFGPANLLWPLDRIGAAVREAAERIGITHLLSRNPRELSGGEKQRVAFASLLALGPAVWLLDEADSALDAAGRAIVAGVIREERKRGAALLVAAEDADAMLGATDRVVLLHQGVVAFDGDPGDLLSRDIAWERGPGGTSVAALARAAHARANATWFAPPYPLDVPEAKARWR